MVSGFDGPGKSKVQVIGLVLAAVEMGGGTGSSEAPMIAGRGRLGADQPMILHMLDIPPAADVLNVVRMVELMDADFLLS